MYMGGAFPSGCNSEPQGTQPPPRPQPRSLKAPKPNPLAPQGKLLLSVRGVPNSAAAAGPGGPLSCGRRTFHVAVQGSFNRDVLASELVSGQEYPKAPRCPSFMHFVFTGAAKVFASTTTVFVQGERARAAAAGRFRLFRKRAAALWPWVHQPSWCRPPSKQASSKPHPPPSPISSPPQNETNPAEGKPMYYHFPVLAAAQQINVSRRGEEPPLLDAPEDVRLWAPELEHKGAPFTPEKRRRFFDAPEKLAGRVIGPEFVWTMHIHQSLIDFSTYKLGLPGVPVHIDLVSILDAQPLQIMAKDNKVRRGRLYPRRLGRGGTQAAVAVRAGWRRELSWML
jgi:hypothetical protein